jgi:hypothetical protein
MPAIVLRFISRAEQLRLRGQRNYSRYMFVVKGFVAEDSIERAQWQKESALESKWDAEWNRRHGPVPGGASILQWRHEREEESQARPLMSADANIG